MDNSDGEGSTEEEWQAQMQASLNWIDQNYYTFRGQNMDVMVILGHADPSNDQNEDFFAILYDRVDNDYSQTANQVLYIYRNFVLLEQQEALSSSVPRIISMDSSLWPPTLVEIGKNSISVGPAELP